MTSIQDIARRAGVSATTVSHVLNKSRYVHPNTVERVMQAVRELNYKPNMVARSLRRRQTHTIGLLVSDIESPFFTELARSVENTAYERGYNTILCNTDENPEKEISYVEVLFAKQVDGLILAPTPGEHTYLRRYVDDGAKVVFVNRFLPGFNSPAVIGDDEMIMVKVISHLITQGHRRFGVVIGIESVTTTQNRLLGLKKALEMYGLSMADAWVFPGEARREGGHRAAKAFISLEKMPTAIITFNSVMHDGFLLGLLDLAPHLINRLEIIGFGYSLAARVRQSAYHYIAQPTYQIGRIATNLLLDAIDKGVPLKAEQIVLENELVGPVSGEDNGDL
ncbi:MAG TPA: LacI family DNA-binding transcriptional regulator [Anaerolineaceae bacterium]